MYHIISASKFIIMLGDFSLNLYKAVCKLDKTKSSNWIKLYQSNNVMNKKIIIIPFCKFK